MTKRLDPAQLRRQKHSANAAPEIAEESFYTIAGELPPLFIRYGREFVKIEGVVSDPDWPQLFRMTATGTLRVLTARSGGVLVGFIFNIVGPHLMYKNVTHGITNAIWLDPLYRFGWFPVRFLRANLDMLKAAGCKRAFVAHDVKWPRLGKVFERLGYKLDELAYARRL